MPELIEEIVDGPSLDQLVKSLISRPGERCAVKFTLADGKEKLVVISCLEWEDGSGNSWNYKGYMPNNNQSVRGYFRTDRLHGHLCELVSSI